MTKEEYFIRIGDRLAPKVLSHTPQLYLYGSNYDLPVPEGSSVIFKAFSRHFLVTAGHCLRNLGSSKLGIWINEEFTPLLEEFFYLDPEKGKDSSDIDLAICELSMSTISSIEVLYTFLDWDDVCLYPEPQSRALQYLIIGFPFKRTKYDMASKIIKPHPFVFLTYESLVESYSRTKMECHSNLLVDLKQKKVMNYKKGFMEKLPKLQGISGCGIWHLLGLMDDTIQFPKYRLAGIMTGQDPTKTIGFSTRMHIVSEMLRIFFKLPVEPSIVTRLN